jgi:hypothetical protein
MIVLSMMTIKTNDDRIYERGTGSKTHEHRLPLARVASGTIAVIK